jgi:integrase
MRPVAVSGGALPTMTTNSQATEAAGLGTVLASNPTAANFPENGPIRESRGGGDGQSERVVPVEFGDASSRFRESSSKPAATPPRKPRNAERRSREYLTPAEVDRLVKAAERLGRHGHRDGTIILVAYRHALRISELCALRWDQVDLAQGLLHVRRRKNGTPSTHPLHGPELRALRRLQRDYGANPPNLTPILR